MSRIIPPVPTLVLLTMLLAPMPAWADATLVVQVRSDIPTTQMRWVSVEVDGAGDRCNNQKQIHSFPTRGRDFNRGVRVLELSSLNDGTHSLVVKAVDGGGRVLTQRPVRVELRSGVRVVTVLLTRDTEDCEATRRSGAAQCAMQAARCRSGLGLRSAAICQRTSTFCQRRVTSRFSECRRRTTPQGGGSLRGIWLAISTGNDDLRGGSDNLDVEVRLRSGRTHVVRNVNRGRSWSDRCRNYAWVPLPASVRNRRDIAAIRLRATLRGGLSGDNWNVQRVAVLNPTGVFSFAVRQGVAGRPLHRFTANRPTFEVRW